jgi:hypothetical protein
LWFVGRRRQTWNEDDVASIGLAVPKEEIAMIMKLVPAVLAVASLVTPALAAEFYIVQDASTKRCQIVEQRPTTSTTVVVGDGKVFTSRSEAETSMRSVEVCSSGTTGTVGGSGSSTTTTTTTTPR